MLRVKYIIRQDIFDCPSFSLPYPTPVHLPNLLPRISTQPLHLAVMDFIKSQLTKIPRMTPRNLSNSTVLITGANTGLGLEAAREILHCKPKRLILAVRNLEKGRLASKELDLAKPPSTQIDVQRLDQASFDSIRNFVKGLEGERVDIAILNAGKFHLPLQFLPAARTMLTPAN